MGPYIVENNHKVSLEKLSKRLPATAYMSELHIQVCELLAKASCADAELLPVLVNLYVTKSSYTKGLTALIILSRHGALQDVELHSNQSDCVLNTLLGPAIKHIPMPRHQALIDKHHVIRAIGKYITHRIFRLFGSRVKRPSSLVRAWTDKAEQLYSTECVSAHVLVYPYNTNFLRSFSFIRSCYRNHRDFSLCGISYSLRLLARVFWKMHRRDSQMAEYERQALVRHGKELAQLGPQTVFTTDDYEPAGFLFHNVLIAAGIHTTNTCHGIAVYGPHVSASRMVFINSFQQKYYSCRSTFKETKSRIPVPTVDAPTKETRPLCVVYIQGKWNLSRKPYEHLFDRLLKDALQESCRATGLEWFVKSHPDLSTIAKYRISIQHHVKVFNDWSVVESRPVIFINFMSTALYDFRERGVTVLVRDDFIDPGTVFGTGHIVIHRRELTKVLRALQKDGYRKERYIKQKTILLQHRVE